MLASAATPQWGSGQLVVLAPGVSPELADGRELGAGLRLALPPVGEDPPGNLPLADCAAHTSLG